MATDRPYIVEWREDDHGADMEHGHSSYPTVEIAEAHYAKVTHRPRVTWARLYRVGVEGDIREYWA